MKSFYSVMKKANEIDQELKRLLKENKDFRREYAKLNASGGSGSDVEALMKRYGAKMNTQSNGRSSSGYGGGFNQGGSGGGKSQQNTQSNGRSSSGYGGGSHWGRPGDGRSRYEKFKRKMKMEKEFESSVDKGFTRGMVSGLGLLALKSIMYETKPEDVPLLENLGVTLGVAGSMLGGGLGARRGKPFSPGRSLAGSLAGALPGFGYAFYSANERSKENAKAANEKKNSSVKKADEDKKKEYGLKELGTSVGGFVGGNSLVSATNLSLANMAKEHNKDRIFKEYVDTDWNRMQDILKKVYKGNAELHGTHGNYYIPFYKDERGKLVTDKGKIVANSTASLLHEIGHAKNYDSLGKLKIPAFNVRALSQKTLLNPLTSIISNIGGNLDPDGEHSGKVMAANALLASPTLLDEGAASIRSVFDRAKLDKRGLWFAAKKQRSMLPAFGTYAAALAAPTLNYHFGRLAGKINNGREETPSE